MTRPRKKSRLKRDSNPGPSALEADALTTRPTRRLIEIEIDLLALAGVYCSLCTDMISYDTDTVSCNTITVSYGSDTASAAMGSP